MNPDPLRPCIFFDRDGVVNQSPGPGYVNHFDDFHLLPGFIDCVRMAAAQGLPAIIVTNQRGITRGITPPEQLETMHRHIQEELAADGEREGMLHRFDSSGRMALGALSYINVESRNRKLLIQAFHTFPDDYAIVKSQSIFELP